MLSLFLNYNHFRDGGIGVGEGLVMLIFLLLFFFFVTILFCSLLYFFRVFFSSRLQQKTTRIRIRGFGAFSAPFRTLSFRPALSAAG